MSKSLVISLVLLVVVGVCGIVGFSNYVSYKNQALALQNQASAKQDGNTLVYDKLWKTLQQEAGVADKYSDAFKENYTSMMEVRYEGKDPMLSFITESNPNFSPALYENLTRDIKSLREEFQANQTALRDIKREHDNLRTMFPSSFFLRLAGIKELQVTLVTSAKTKEVFKTGEENDVDLFHKK